MAIFTQVIKRFTALGMIIGVLLMWGFDDVEASTGFTIAEEASTYEYSEVCYPNTRITWRFKIENGVKYKRKYDWDNMEWVGDWIPVK